MRNSVFLGLLLCLGCSTALGQLDPNVYRPHIGIKSEFDTIYGHADRQIFGSIVRNLPDPLDKTHRRMLVSGFEYQNNVFTYPYIFDGSAPVDLHHLSPEFFHVEVPYYPDYIIPGHFRSTKYLDLLYAQESDAKIYWADDNGNYDSSRSSYLLLKPMRDSQHIGYSPKMKPYVGKFSSDSLDDIVLGCESSYFPLAEGLDTFYVGYFQGGNKDISPENEKIYTDKIAPVSWYDFPSMHFTLPFKGIQGDFRGTGNDDFVMADVFGNLYYYKFRKPFSIFEFARSLREDTLFAFWQNPETHSETPFLGKSPLSIKAFPKSPTDQSTDFAAPIFRDDENEASFYFWRGGPDFGKKRISLENEEFRMRDPSHYDEFTFGLVAWPESYYDCGDMTGTGNHTLVIIAGGVPAGVEGLMFFYVLGTALDDKADMLIGWENEGQPNPTSIDTLDANGDGLEDVMIGMPGFVSTDDAINKDFRSVGSLGILYGSKKIPVQNTSVPSSEVIEQFTLYPNPVHRQSTLFITTQQSKELTLILRDILGREVYRSNKSVTEGSQQIPMVFPRLTAGTYYLEVSGSGLSFKSLPVFLLEE